MFIDTSADRGPKSESAVKAESDSLRNNGIRVSASLTISKRV
jgi:hypothetical protein